MYHVSRQAASLIALLMMFGAVRAQLLGLIPDLDTCQAAGLVRSLQATDGRALIPLLIAGPRLRTDQGRRVPPPSGQHAYSAALSAELAAVLTGHPTTLTGIHHAMSARTATHLRYDRRAHVLAVVDQDGRGAIHRVLPLAPTRTAEKLTVLTGEALELRLGLDEIISVTCHVPPRHVRRTRRSLPGQLPCPVMVTAWQEGW